MAWKKAQRRKFWLCKQILEAVLSTLSISIFSDLLFLLFYYSHDNYFTNFNYINNINYFNCLVCFIYQVNCKEKFGILWVWSTTWWTNWDPVKLSIIKLGDFPCISCISKTVEDTSCDHFGTEKKQKHLLKNDSSKQISYPIK